VKGRARGRGSTAGFTLVEMLVALTLIGLLSAGLFGGLRLGARAWEAGGERIAETNDTESARTFLRKRMAQTQSLTYFSRSSEDAFAFRGERDRLRFAAPWPQHLGGIGIYVFELGPADDGRGLQLDWMLYRPNGPVAVNESREHPRRLFNDAEDVHFRYYGRVEGEDDPRWHDTWRDTERLPRVIEMALRQEGRKGWPPLRVAIAAADGR
jgi:general secretion pathway protein J